MREQGCKMPPDSVSKRHEAVDDIKRELESEIGARRFQHWFGTRTTLSFDGSELTVAAPSPYLATWIQRQFQGALEESIRRAVGVAGNVTYSVTEPVVLTPPDRDSSRSAPRMASVHRTTTPEGTSGALQRRRYADLQHFVVGPCNDLAMAAAQQVAQEPGSASPLFVHGGVGVGKSHLLEGLGLAVRREYPQHQTLLLTAEQFANYFTQALGARSLPSFRHRFRGVDVLLVDDIDFFDGKKAIQEEFLHTVKNLIDHGRQVVVSSDRHPRLLTRTCDELVSRYLSGLVCRIEAPDLETRLEIVRRLVERHRLKMSPSVCEFVAKRFRNNVREIEGAMNVLATWVRMTKGRVTMTVARDVLGRLERDCLRIVRMADIERAVCDVFGVESEDLKSASRQRSIVQPRMLAMYLARRLTQAAYKEIGTHFGGRNHATVMSAEKKIERLCQQQESWRLANGSWAVSDVVEMLEDRIKAG